MVYSMLDTLHYLYYYVGLQLPEFLLDCNYNRWLHEGKAPEPLPLDGVLS